MSTWSIHTRNRTPAVTCSGNVALFTAKLKEAERLLGWKSLEGKLELAGYR